MAEASAAGDVIYHGDLFDVLPTLEAESIDACVTDPPYGIGFMGKEWDTFRPGYRKDGWDYGQDAKGSDALHAADYDRSLPGMRRFEEWTERWAREVFRVLKPGAHIVVCGAPRAYHRMACGIEDAGFEIRDCFAWLFGSGFPKSLNLGNGLGTALKPAHEPIVLARKPFKGTVRANVDRHGTGALNIDACRINTLDDRARPPGRVPGATWDLSDREEWSESHKLGRWPANVVLDPDAAMVLDEQSGELVSGSYSGERHTDKTRNCYGAFEGTKAEAPHEGSIGGASRFYYVAKPSREERDMGCHDLPERSPLEITGRVEGSAGSKHGRAGMTGRPRGNIHPTVKPVELMRWLVRLVTPPGGTVLDPFIGSGTTGMACRYELREFIGIEREAEYVAIAERRIAAVAPLFATDVDASEPEPPAQYSLLQDDERPQEP